MPLKPKTAVLTDPSPDTLLFLHCDALLTAIASSHMTLPCLQSDTQAHTHPPAPVLTLHHLCCRPGHARSGGSLALDLDSLQMAAAETNSTGKQDSPRTIMIKANLQKVSLRNIIG